MADPTTPPHPAIDLMRAHRSVRSYTDEPVPHADIESAVRAGQSAATSSAVQAYCCIRVTDPEHRSVLAQLAGPQEKVRSSPELFVVCADDRRHRLICARAGRAYDQRLEGFLIGVIDATLFAQNMVLAFEAMGYGTCYIGGLRNDAGKVVRTLSLPEGVYPLYGLCVGKPAEDPSHRPRLPVETVLFEGRCPTDDEVLEQIDEYDETYREYLRTRGASEQAVGASWSGAMAAKYAKVYRPDLASVYRSQGARLD